MCKVKAICILFILISFQVFGQNLDLKFYLQNSNPSVAEIHPIIKIQNLGQSTVDLGLLKIRYYRTKEGTTDEYMNVYYTQVGAYNVNYYMTDSYYEIGYKSNSGMLYQWWEINVDFAVHKADWSLYDQSNDFSFMYSSNGNFINNYNIAVFYNNVKVWGNVPAVVTTPIVTEAPSETPYVEVVTAAPVVTAVPEVATPSPEAQISTPYPVDGAETILIEAEDAACYWPWASKSDSYNDLTPDTSASQEIFMGIMGYANAPYSAPSDGHIVFTFTPSQSDYYSIYVRTNSPYNGSDELWISIDSGSFFKWDPQDGGNFVSHTWMWNKANESYFSAGSTHTFTLAYTNEQNKIDMLAVSNDPAFESNMPGPVPLSTATSMETAPVNPPAPRYGHLKVVNGQICDANGNPVQLRGIATHGPQWYRVVPGKTIANMKLTFGIDVVRLAMYVDGGMPGDYWNGYMADKNSRKYYISQLVNDAIEQGLYVIIDWHVHKNMDFNDEYLGQAIKPEAIKFFDEMSRIYSSYPHVLFEIANETGAGEASWAQLKAYSEDLIPVIRNNDRDGYKNLIIVPTPDWDQQIAQPISNRISSGNSENVLYAFHFYAASHDYLKSQLTSALNAKLPVFVSEFGTCDYSVAYNNFSQSDSWINSYLNPNKISWVNWALSNRDDASALLKPGVSMAGPWTEDDLTETGKYIKDRIDGITTVVTAEPTPEPTPFFGMGSSASNPICFSSSDMGYYRPIDLSNGYAWVMFPKPVSQLYLRNTGIQFAVTVEDANNQSLVGTNGSMLWDWNTSMKSYNSNLYKLVWNGGNYSVGIDYETEESVEASADLPMVHFASYNYSFLNIQHRWGGQAVLSNDANLKANAQFRLVPGLADPSKVSIESVNFPGMYLRHSNYKVYQHPYDGSQSFREDATWTKVPGLAGGNGYSFSSYNYPDHFIRHIYGYIQINQINTDQERQDATFIEIKE
ncbi:MAG: cellulase family glycosylhydrolase [Spirochaetales bacterium]|nr:cellulase family glycosylhydrolase [Spirochaetales bacterium]